MRSLVALSLAICLVACTDPNSTTPPQGPADKGVETPPAPVLSAHEELETFVIAAPFKVELAAAEPALEDPVAADWDEDGHLYVAEMRAYMNDLDGSGEERPIGAVVRLKDTNGDGQYDHREELANDLVLPRVVRIINAGLLIGEMGKLWLCPSATGWSRDIDCSIRRFLGPYGEHQGSVEHAENGLLVGLDNWMYSAKSSRRLKVVDGELLEEPTIFRGQWGITQDDHGRLYYNTNSNLLLGDFYDAQAYVEAGNRRAAGLNQRISPKDEVFAIRVNTGVNRAYLPGVLRDDGRLRNATSASGMVVYKGGRFPASAPDAYVAEPAANVVTAFELKEDGITVSAEQMLYPDEKWGQRDFLASTDERFRPVDVFDGPDGNVYVLDFYRGVIQDHVYLSPELRAQAEARKLDRPLGMGRLWRIVQDGTGTGTGTESDREWTLPDWRDLTQQQLLDQLSHANVWHRNTAQRLLLKGSDPSLAVKLSELVRHGSEQGAVRALWILLDRGELDQATLRIALERRGSVAEAGLLAGRGVLTYQDLLAMPVAAMNSRLSLYRIAALGVHNDVAEVRDYLMQALASPQTDAHVRDAVQSAAGGQEPLFIRMLVEGQVWARDLEQRHGLIRKLALQMFRSQGAAAEHLLDDVRVSSIEHLWVDRAILQGLFEHTRDPGFERVQLASAHPLFADEFANGSKDGKGELAHALAQARRGFTWPGDALPAGAKPLNSEQRERYEQGAAFYAQNCANCHGADGMGIASLGPRLAQSSWVTDAPERLVRIVLQGLQGPIEVRGEQWNSVMPGHQDFAGFDDAVTSGLLTYLRRSWGHSERTIDPAFVAHARSQTSGRSTPWTAAELAMIEVNTHFKIYAGAYGRPSQPLKFAYESGSLHVHAGIFNGPLETEREDHFLFAPRQLGYEFVLDADGEVVAVVMSSGDDQFTLPKLP